MWLLAAESLWLTRLDLPACERGLRNGARQATVRQGAEEATRAAATGTAALFINGHLLSGTQPQRVSPASSTTSWPGPGEP